MTAEEHADSGHPVAQDGASPDEARLCRTAEGVAALQARAYIDTAPWSAADIAETLRHPAALLVASPDVFCLGRVIADEAEILALATDPACRRRGLASRVLDRFCGAAHDRGAHRVFLEVAATNGAARALYDAHGFAATGVRKGYYRHFDGGRIDAVLMSRALTRGHVHSTRRGAKSS